MIPVVRPKEDECCCNDRRKNKEHEWKEARLAIARSKGSVEHICAVTLGSTDDAGKKLAEVIKSAGEGEKTKIHCVGDGAFWIAEQIEQLFGAKATFLLDFYHVSEYLAKASICCEPEMSFAWMRTQQSLLKCNGVDNVLKNMQEHIQVCPLKEDCAALKCFNYLEKRLNQLDYKSAIESDLPIGSGEVESAHRSIVQARLKIPGAWWDIQNAQNMLDLRTTRSNGLWDQYWNNIRPISEVCANG